MGHSRRKLGPWDPGSAGVRANNAGEVYLYDLSSPPAVADPQGLNLWRGVSEHRIRRDNLDLNQKKGFQAIDA
jgi:hypothetical protein